MKKSFSLLFFVVASFLSHTVFAQTKTPYQQRVTSLTLQFLKDIGSSPSVIKKYTETGSTEGILPLSDEMTRKLKTAKGFNIMLEYSNKVNEAASLKNAIDHKIDKEKRLVQQRKKDFENSDYNKLSAKIKDKYEKWTQKGEFEKTADYESRINTESAKVFSQICASTIHNKIVIYDSTHIANSNYPIEIKLGDYNADKEQFNVVLKAVLEDKYSKKDIGNATINIPINEAQALKENFREFYIAEQSYKFFVNTSDWCFANNNLLPKKIAIKGNDKTYFIVTQLDNVQDVIFTTQDLKIQNINVTFNYNKEAPMILEDMRKEELRKKEEKDKDVKFKRLVDGIDDGVFAEKFKGKKFKEIEKADYGAYIKYNQWKVKTYQRALKIKEDAEVRKKMEECEADIQQTEGLEKKGRE